MDYISKEEFLEFKKEFEERVRSLGKKHSEIETFYRDALGKIDHRLKTLEGQIPGINNFCSEIKSKFSDLRTYSLEQAVCLNDLDRKNCSTFHHITEQLKNVEEFRKKLHLKITDINEFIESDKSNKTTTDSILTQISNVRIHSDAMEKLYKEDIKVIQKDIEFLKQMSSENASQIHNFEISLYNFKRNADDLDIKFQINNNYLVKEYKKVYDKTEEDKEFILSLISEELEQIVIPDVTHFIRDNELNQIKHDVHLSCLDARNSMIKCANIEMQQTISSKKLENIQLKLDRLELSKI